MSGYLSPEQIKEYVVETGIKKAGNALNKNFWLSFMGGLFIALAAIGSLIATCTISNYSLASLVAGVVFSTGLMLVVIAGGDLFTGNVLIILSVFQKKTTWRKMTWNLGITFLGNLCGAFLVVLLIHYSGILTNANGLLIGTLMSKAIHKIEYSFCQAFSLGILCNLLVCLAVWMMYSAKDTGGKVLACLFPITLFILSGYEHIVANMYYIPAGILASMDKDLLGLSGVSQEAAIHLSVTGAIHNFIPVTLGNLIGGLLIGGVYTRIYHNQPLEASNSLKMGA